MTKTTDGQPTANIPLRGENGKFACKIKNKTRMPTLPL